MLPREFRLIKRRNFLALASAGVLRAADTITRPAVSQAACPIKRATPVAADGHRGLAFVRTPPGKGPFPAAIIVHGGLVTWPEQQTQRVRPQLAGTIPIPCGRLRRSDGRLSQQR